jgi:hypothetical protein
MQESACLASISICEGASGFASLSKAILLDIILARILSIKGCVKPVGPKLYSRRCHALNFPSMSFPPHGLRYFALQFGVQDASRMQGTMSGEGIIAREFSYGSAFSIDAFRILWSRFDVSCVSTPCMVIRSRHTRCVQTAENTPSAVTLHIKALFDKTY